MATLVKQLRRVTLPLDTLVAYLDRRVPELTNTKFHHAIADENSRRLFLYVEAPVEQDPTQPVPVDLDVNWDEIFGRVTCPTCGEQKPVEDVVVCTQCAAWAAASIPSPMLPGSVGAPRWVGCAAGNYATGRLGHKPEAIVIHLMDGTLAGTDAWFLTSPEKRTPPAASSAHYGIGKSGEVHQYVKDEDRAYHAGITTGATWDMLGHGALNPNLFTLGIEHEGTVNDEWPEQMVSASAQMVSKLAAKYSVPVDREHVVGHHEIYSGHTCPGPKCPLDRIVELAKEIVGLAPPVS